MNPRRLLGWPMASLAGNALFFIVLITADFYGWIPSWATVLGLVVGTVWLYVNRLLPRAWYGWLKPLATSLGWYGLLQAELLHDSSAARMAGRWDRAAPLLEAAAVAAARRGDARSAQVCLTDAAMGYVFEDDFDKARRCRDAAADLAGTLGDEAARRNVRWLNGIIAWYSGDRVEAHRLLEDFAAHEAGADRICAGVAVLALAQMDSDEGNHERGLARLTAFQSEELASPRMSVLGLILLRTGRFKSARVALERARSIRSLSHRTANTLAEESLTFALLDLAEGNAEPAQQALLATAESHSHDIRMLQGDLLTALGGMEERGGSSERARGFMNAALKAYQGIAPAKVASLHQHLGGSSAVATDEDPGDPLALYYAWPPRAVDEASGPVPAPTVAPLLDRRRRRISPNAVASIATAALTLIFFLPLGWPAAIGLLALLAIHEFGHYFGARVVGVQARTPIFLGLLGAATIVDRQRVDPGRDAIITLGGPAAGLTVAAVCLSASMVAPSPWHTVLIALARGGFILNLLQLFPVLPLDGGHVAAGLHRAWLMAGLLLQLAFVVFLLRNPGENVVAIAFVALTIAATVWMFRRDQPQRSTGSGRGLVAIAYLTTVAIGAGGLVAGFIVPFRAPTQVVGSQIIGDGFIATMPEGWDPRSVCCDEVLGLIHHYQTGAHTAIDVYDLRGGFGLADPRASSPTEIAQEQLATELQQPDSSALQPIEPIARSGLDGVQFTYACACEGGYPGELFTSDVVILQHGSRVVSITLATYTQEYDGDHASLEQLVDGWSWTTAG